MKTFDKLPLIKEIVVYTTCCFLDYNYFKNYYKTRAIELSKQHALDANPKAIQLINFTGNLNQGRQTAMFFILEKVKETLTKNCESVVILFCFNIILV